MKFLFKKLYFYYNIIIDTLVSIISILFFSSFSSRKSMFLCSIKYKRNDECIVMGNGPSLSDLMTLYNFQFVNKDVLAVNFFCFSDFFLTVKPSFYVLLDPDLFNNCSDKLMESNIRDFIEKINRVSWDMALFIPSGKRNSLIINSLKNDKIDVIEFNSTPISSGIAELDNFLFKNNLGMPMPQSVIIAGVFLALNLKYKKCHLFGVEQSWLKHLSINNNNEILVGLNHFYPSSGVVDETRSLSEFLLSQSILFRSHNKLNEYAEYLGSSIINHTPESYIDAYPRHNGDCCKL
jgi:hypothetical protein